MERESTIVVYRLDFWGMEKDKEEEEEEKEEKEEEEEGSAPKIHQKENRLLIHSKRKSHKQMIPLLPLPLPLLPLPLLLLH